MPANAMNNSDLGEIVIYQPPDGVATIYVRLTGETLWLTQAQIAELFQKERSVVTKHLRNIFSQGELERASVSAFFAHTAADGKTYQVEYFNLDAILSVGYRVNSAAARSSASGPRGCCAITWSAATRPTSADWRSCAVRCAWWSTLAAGDAVSADEATALLRVVTDYAYALDLLDDYDHQRVTVRRPRPASRSASLTMRRGDHRPAAREVRRVVPVRHGKGRQPGQLTECHHADLRRGGCLPEPGGEGGASPLLPGEEPQLRGRQQAHRGRALPVVHGEERHAPSRRCARRIADNALVAITLLIAVSEPAEKRVIISMVVNLINGRN